MFGVNFFLFVLLEFDVIFNILYCTFMVLVYNFNVNIFLEEE